MNIDFIIGLAKMKVTGRVPRYINLNDAIAMAKMDIANAVTERVHSAMEEAILGAQSVLQTTCQQYIEDLYIADDCTIQIRERSRHLEEGFDARDMKEDLLSSPSAKVDDEGNRRVVVPVGKQQGSHVSQAVSKRAAELFSKGRRAGASSRTLSDMANEMTSIARTSTNRAPKEPGKDGFKTVSDKQSEDSWIHPGFAGVRQLAAINMKLLADLEEDAIRLIEAEVDRMRR